MERDTDGENRDVLLLRSAVNSFLSKMCRLESTWKQAKDTFSPETVESLQQAIRERCHPNGAIQIPGNE